MLHRLLPLGLVFACAPELGLPDADDPSVSPRAGDASATPDGDTTKRVIDASADNTWIRVDLDAGAIAADLDDTAWDLAVQRFQWKSNGGVSGDGAVQIAAVDGADFADVDAIPQEGWRTDEAGTNEFGFPNHALGDWFEYDHATHNLASADRVYVVQTTEGAYYKLAIDGYYDDTGSPGYHTVRWAPLP